jgi:hypothetical protein
MWALWLPAAPPNVRPHMSNKWRGLHGPITAEAAEREPEAQRLFGPSYEAKMRQHAARRQHSGIDREKYRPWRKPRIERVKR